MNRTSNTIIRFIILAACLLLVGADLTVRAQNSNSSTTQEDPSSPVSIKPPTVMNRTAPRRGRRRRGANLNEGQTPNTGILSPGKTIATARPAGMGRCDPMAQEQADLSGAYTGTVNYPEAGLSGEATLTISGNKFTMTSGSTTQEGRITAVTTCNYTGVTMMFGSEQMTAASGPQPAPLPAVSLEAKRMGSSLSLKSVPGETRQFWFGSAPMVGGVPPGAGGGGRVHRARPKKSGSPVSIKPPTVRVR